MVQIHPPAPLCTQHWPVHVTWTSEYYGQVQGHEGARVPAALSVQRGEFESRVARQDWATSRTVIRLPCTQQDGVRLPGCPPKHRPLLSGRGTWAMSSTSLPPLDLAASPGASPAHNRYDSKFNSCRCEYLLSVSNAGTARADGRPITFMERRQEPPPLPWSVRLAARTSGLHPEYGGSSPPRSTILCGKPNGEAQGCGPCF